MTCPDCTGFTSVKIDERTTRGMVELCPVHALNERLAEALRETLPCNLDEDNVSPREIAILQLLQEYDSVKAQSGEKG